MATIDNFTTLFFSETEELWESPRERGDEHQVWWECSANTEMQAHTHNKAASSCGDQFSLSIVIAAVQIQNFKIRFFSLRIFL